MSSIATPAVAHRGVLLIGVGLAVVLLAQVWPVVPIATALMVVGSGATLTLLARQGTGAGWLAWLNLAVYAMLGCFAIGAQAHAAVTGPTGPTGQVGLLLMIDHTAAALLLVVLGRTVLGGMANRS